MNIYKVTLKDDDVFLEFDDDELNERESFHKVNNDSNFVISKDSSTLSPFKEYQSHSFFALGPDLTIISSQSNMDLFKRSEWNIVELKNELMICYPLEVYNIHNVLNSEGLSFPNGVKLVTKYSLEAPREDIKSVFYVNDDVKKTIFCTDEFVARFTSMNLDGLRFLKICG